MRFLNRGVACVVVLMIGTWFFSLPASEDIIILEQDYKLLESTKGKSPEAKDIRQVLYITRDIVAIDEFGEGADVAPTETFVYDLKLQRIVNIDHKEKKILIDESFADRRGQIQRRIKNVQAEIDSPDNTKAIKDRFLKTYATMIDGTRNFAIENVEGTKDLAGVKCKTVKVVDAKDAAYPPLEITLHPDMDMPYDNSELLFLVTAVGENMAQFLKSKQTIFSRVPMEMHIQTPEGGKIDTKAVKVTKMKLDAFDPKARGFGNPFVVPEGYTIVRKLSKKEKAKEKAD